ncbi:hypothetical protein Hanom_Chr12g01125951 [Helianthus anomalus]
MAAPQPVLPRQDTGPLSHSIRQLIIIIIMLGIIIYYMQNEIFIANTDAKV